jgi:hypothetical protein
MHPTTRHLLAASLGALLAASTAGVSAQTDPQDAHQTGDAATDPPATQQSDGTDWQQAGTPPKATTQDRASQLRDETKTPRDDAGFARLDVDHDGRISSAEAGADGDFNSRFATLDSNGDGYVSQAEFDADAQVEMPPRP